jgi:hypothetical protein
MKGNGAAKIHVGVIEPHPCLQKLGTQEPIGEGWVIGMMSIYYLKRGVLNPVWLVIIGKKHR